MSKNNEDDDDMPKLEDFNEQLKEIRKNKGINLNSQPSNIKVGVVNENKINENNNQKGSKNTVSIPISNEPEKKRRSNKT